MSYKEIANIIGAEAKDIERIVTISNERKILYHGIKRAEYVEKIKTEGLKPLTPESGPCSFWATGFALFYPTLDSPFFRYSGHHSSSEVCELNLAITEYDRLSEIIQLPSFETDSQLKIKHTIPIDLITMLNVTHTHSPSEDYRELRRYAQKAEQKLLKKILEYLNP